MSFLILLLIFIPLIIITSITPYITRKTESFGVLIPSNVYHNPILQKLRKQYLQLSIIVGVILVGVLLAISSLFNEETFYATFIISTFVYIFITFAIYLYFHKKMKQLKSTEKWFEKKRETIVVDTNFYKEKKVVSYLWFILPLIITISTGIWSIINYDQFPDRLPMQYNMSGEVTRYADKSIVAVLSLPFLQLFLTGLFMFINYVIAKSKQQIDPANPEESIEQNLIFRRRWSVYLIVSGTLLVAMFAVPQVSFIYEMNLTIMLSLIFAVVGITLLGALLITITTGQGGSRVKLGKTKDGDLINRDDDRYWKLGVFYFNPEDPAIWIEKRFGSGWTMNFARPQGWLIFIVIILIPIAIAIFTS